MSDRSQLTNPNERDMKEVLIMFYFLHLLLDKNKHSNAFIHVDSLEINNNNNCNYIP